MHVLLIASGKRNPKKLENAVVLLYLSFHLSPIFTKWTSVSLWQLITSPFLINLSSVHGSLLKDSARNWLKFPSLIDSSFFSLWCLYFWLCSCGGLIVRDHLTVAYCSLLLHSDLVVFAHYCLQLLQFSDCIFFLDSKLSIFL